MLRSNWRYVITASGLIIFALSVAAWIGWKLQPEKPTLAGDGAYQEIASGYHAGGASCEPESLGRFHGREAQSKKERCEEAAEQHRESADGLIEARRAADAADASAIAAYKQTGIAAWGAGLGFVTMIAAIGAALFAERAAYHTKRSANTAETSAADTVDALKIAERNAKASEASVAHAIESSRLEQRPWVFVSRAYYKSPKVVTIEVINYGKTPALDITIQTGCLVVPHPMPKNTAYVTPPTRECFTLGPGVPFDISMEIPQEIPEGHALYFPVTIWYNALWSLAAGSPVDRDFRDGSYFMSRVDDVRNMLVRQIGDGDKER